MVRSSICRQRVGLSSPAVEGEHELTPDPFAERVALDECCQLRREIAVKPKRQLGIDAALEGGKPGLLQARDFRLHERLERGLHERRTGPECERFP